jgi:hypothetical protein
MHGDRHADAPLRPLDVQPFRPVNADEREEAVEHECTACECKLDPEEVERGAIVCDRCSQQLGRELAAYLAFIAETRSA